MRLVIEIWADAGRLIAHPVYRGKTDSSWSYGVQLSIPYATDLINELPNSEYSPAEFERGVEEIQHSLSSALLEAAATPFVSEIARQVHLTMKLRVFLQLTDDRMSRELVPCLSTSNSDPPKA